MSKKQPNKVSKWNKDRLNKMTKKQLIREIGCFLSQEEVHQTRDMYLSNRNAKLSDILEQIVRVTYKFRGPYGGDQNIALDIIKVLVGQ